MWFTFHFCYSDIIPCRLSVDTIRWLDGEASDGEMGMGLDVRIFDVAEELETSLTFIIICSTFAPVLSSGKTP